MLICWKITIYEGFLSYNMLDRYGTALNIISNSDLEFLGLTSLKKISSGHVLIESNDKLCYVDGLNWKKLHTKGTTKQTEFIRNNADNDRFCSE